MKRNMTSQPAKLQAIPLREHFSTLQYPKDCRLIACLKKSAHWQRLRVVSLVIKLMLVHSLV